MMSAKEGDAEWVEVTDEEYYEAFYRMDSPRVRDNGTRDSDGDWTIVRFIHRDDLTPPDPDADLIPQVRHAVGIGDEFSPEDAKALIALVDEHRGRNRKRW